MYLSEAPTESVTTPEGTVDEQAMWTQLFDLIRPTNSPICTVTDLVDAAPDLCLDTSSKGYVDREGTADAGAGTL